MEITENWCNTGSKLVRLNFIWTIENFSFCTEENSAAINCLPFSEGPNNQYVFHLSFYPKGTIEASIEYLSLFLNFDSAKESDIRAVFKFSVLNSENEKRHCAKSELRRFYKGCNYGFHKFIKRNILLYDADNLIPGDKLTLACEVNIVCGKSATSGQSNQIKVPTSKLAQDFGNIFKNRKFSDVTIIIDDLRIRAHKIILSARSTVFAAMFEHQMEEATSNCVYITDIEYNVFVEMFRFIYTGEAPNIDGMAASLLAAADKYDLEVLKVLCEKALCSNITVETAAETLVLADLHSALQLKTAAIDFISSNATAVMETQGWEYMTKTNIHLITEVIRAIPK